VKSIQSRENAQFKLLLKLAHSSRERKKLGQTLLDGVHLVRAYNETFGVPRALVVSASSVAKPEIAALLQALPAVSVSVFPDAMFNEVAPVQTPTGVLALIDTPREAELPRQLATCIVVEDVQDPGNLGALLRSAAAAGVEHALLSRGCTFAWAPRVVRAGMGAHFALKIYEQVDVPNALANYSGRIVALTGSAEQSLFDIDLRGEVAFLIGNEGAGLSPQWLGLAHAQVRIPMPGNIESLNAAAAAAIAMFERVRQINATAT
jgi:TrmH family RNA methyltransferase